MTNLNQLSIIEAKKGLENKEFSSSELVSSCLNRITEIDPRVKAFITVCEKKRSLKQRKLINKLIIHH